MPRFEGLIPMLIVERIEPTRDFFRDRLGFAVTDADGPADALRSVTMNCDAVAVAIRSHAGARASFGENYVEGPYRAAISIVVDDVEAVVPAIADLDIVLPLRKTPAGMHEIGVREPGGNVIVLGSRIAATRTG